MDEPPNKPFGFIPELAPFVIDPDPLAIGLDGVTNADPDVELDPTGGLEG